jgi:ankyrin repeat protein
MDGRNELHEACLHNDLEKIKTLRLRADFKSLVNKQDSFGRIPLHWAVWKGNLEAVELLKDESDLKTVDLCGCPPIHWASKSGFVDIAKVLLNKCPEAALFQNKKGNTALHRAYESNSSEMVNLLPKHEIKNRDFKKPGEI